MKSRKKILIVRLNAIGDVILSTIIPYAIKYKHPEYEIHYLTSSTNATILKNCSYIDKVIPFNGSFFKSTIEAFKERYDVIISLNYTLKNYVLTFLSFPKKFVFKSHKGTSWIENYFYTAKNAVKDVDYIPSRLYLQNRFSNEIATKNLLAKYPKPHIIINPGRSTNQPRAGRIWDIKKWKELAKKLLKLYGGTIFVNGSEDEREYHFQLADENIVILSGLYNIENSCTIISQADLVISGDSGPAHIASAFGIKTLVLLGSTSPEKIKPYGSSGYYLEPCTSCRYCWKKTCKFLPDKSGYAPCIESINTDMVMEKIKSCNLLIRETAK